MSEPKTQAEIHAEKLAKKKEAIQAFQRLFSGQGSAKDAEIVMEDLRKRCFYDYPTRSLPGQPEYIRDQNEGLRMAFLHIKGRIKADPNQTNLTPEDL